LIEIGFLIKKLKLGFSEKNSVVKLRFFLPFQKLLLHKEKIQSQIKEKRISLTEISTNEDFLKNSEELLLSSKSN